MDGDYKVGALLYKDCQLTKVRVDGEEEWRLDITCRKTKGSGPPKTFQLSERKTRIFCPIVLFLCLAFLDDAFQSLDHPGGLTDIYIPSYRQSLTFSFKETVHENPVFRQVWRGLRVTTEALSANQFRKDLKALSLAAGFPVPVLPYAIRRGAVNTLEGKATDAQRNQIMGHHNSSVFKYYISQKIPFDTQSAFLGCDTQREVAEMSLGMDRRFPKKLSEAEENAIYELPSIKDLASDIEAQRTPNKHLVDKRRHRIRRAKKSALANKRAACFTEICTTEIQSQLLDGEGEDLDEAEMLSVPARLPELFDKGSLQELLLAIFDLVSDHDD